MLREWPFNHATPAIPRAAAPRAGPRRCGEPLRLHEDALRRPHRAAAARAQAHRRLAPGVAGDLRLAGAVVDLALLGLHGHSAQAELLLQAPAAGRGRKALRPRGRQGGNLGGPKGSLPCVCVCVCICADVHECLGVYVHVYADVRACRSVFVYVYGCGSLPVHVHAHIRTCMCMSVFLSPSMISRFGKNPNLSAKQ